MIYVLTALLLGPTWARTIHVVNQPALARCVAQLFSGEVTPSDDPTLVAGALTQLKDARAKVQLDDTAVNIRQEDLLPDVATDFQKASKTLIDTSHLRLRQVLDGFRAKDAVSVVHVRKGAAEIEQFLDQMDGLTERVDTKFRDTKVKKFGLKETIGKAVALAAAVGVGWVAHRQGLTSDNVFRATTVFPALVTGFYLTLRRVTYLASLWRSVEPPRDERRIRFDGLVAQVRSALANPPIERPRTLHFGTNHVFTGDFAESLRQARTLDEVTSQSFTAFARSRRHLILSYLRNFMTLQVGALDYIFTAATPDSPPMLVTVARIRRVQPIVDAADGGQRDTRPQPPTHSSDEGLAGAGI